MDKIFGYTFEDIRRAQQGDILGRPISLKDLAVTEKEKESAIDMLHVHGQQELEKLGFHGIIDILDRCGIDGEMTNENTSTFILEWCDKAEAKEDQVNFSSWITDVCGQYQYYKFINHINLNFKPGQGFIAVARQYANMLLSAKRK